jgi:hypothetical protein
MPRKALPMERRKKATAPTAPAMINWTRMVPETGST